MDRDEYIVIQISIVPQEFVEKYDLAEKSHNGYIYARVTNGMYGLPQAVQISYDAMLKHLDPYGYHPSSKKSGLWKHNIRPINFTLVVDDFGVKYSGKEHALHLKEALETKYKVTTDWKGKFYIGIALMWDYDKGTVQLSMSGYVHAALHAFQQEKHKLPQDWPYLWTQPVYGRKKSDAVRKVAS